MVLQAESATVATPSATSIPSFRAVAIVMVLPSPAIVTCTHPGKTIVGGTG